MPIPSQAICVAAKPESSDPVTATWDRARAVADAVLYEGYLLERPCQRFDGGLFRPVADDDEVT